MPSLERKPLLIATLGLFAGTSIAADINAGFNAYKAADVMVARSSHSWEWGTAAEALLELYNPELSVFAGNPFPGGKIPNVGNTDNILALKYARQFINRNSQVFVGNSAVGDPASLGVSALLLGQSDNVYIQASNRQADYLLKIAPRWSNGAISHRPDVSELWADNVAMSFPFLAYLAVQHNDLSLMAETVKQCGLYRDVLKAQDLNWRHIIGPQSQDTGLWSTGNGWAAYGMTRVLHTLQKWPSSSSSLGSQAGQLKSWIKEILDGAMALGTDDGLLRNYLNDNGWFGEISGTAVLSAVAYRMAVNDPGMFSKKYITWADNNRKAVARHQRGDGVFAPAVNPYNWRDRAKYNVGSPEGQAFAVYLYTAYRDCVNAGVCEQPPSPTTISKPGIGPIDIIATLHAPITFSNMPDPTGTICGIPQSCDADDCNGGSFAGNTKYPTCQGGSKKGCQCKATSKTCGPHASCDANGCDGSFNGLGNTKYAQCKGNFEGCECLATPKTCGPHASCDANGCDGSFNGLGNTKYAQCKGNFEGCECLATSKTCGLHQRCDLNGCAGSFNGLGNVDLAQCTGNFKGCKCLATPASCGPPQSCGNNGCKGAFNLDNGKAYCTSNFVGCECKSNPGTCGSPQSCDNGNCDGKFMGKTTMPVCTNFFKDCVCKATDKTCGPQQSCDDNGCAGGYDANGVARCQGNFRGCKCNASKNTCGTPQDCDKNGCDGTFDANSNTARCRGKFKGCVCDPVPATCGERRSCSLNGCNGAFDSNANPICMGNFFGCPCIPDPIWIPPPPQLPPPQQPQHTSEIVISLEVSDNDDPVLHPPNTWHVFNLNGVFSSDGLCFINPLVTAKGGSTPYPTSMPPFNVENFTNCVYSGSRGSVGTLTCNGNPQISCSQGKGGSNCRRVSPTQFPFSGLFWTIQCTIRSG